MMFNDKVYQALKFVAQIGLPAIGALYFSLAQIWGLPKAEEFVGTVTVVDTFLGVLLGLSSASYNASDKKYDGQMNIHEDGSGRMLFELDVSKDPEVLGQKDEVAFKVVRN